MPIATVAGLNYCWTTPSGALRFSEEGARLLARVARADAARIRRLAAEPSGWIPDSPARAHLTADRAVLLIRSAARAARSGEFFWPEHAPEAREAGWALFHETQRSGCIAASEMMQAVIEWGREHGGDTWEDSAEANGTATNSTNGG